MRFLVDGYNVTRSDPATRESSLEVQREALVARLAARGCDLLGPGEITVVFDGVAGGGPEAGRGSVKVRYAHRPDSADDLIVRLAGGGDVTVVTSDTGLGGRVRALGANVVASATCHEAVQRRRRGKGRYPASTAGLPPGANQITAELKELWLKDGE